jgi:hypothetical protein
VRRAVVFGLAAAAIVGGTASQAEAWPWSHRVTISGQFVNHWTVSDPGHCGVNGDGTVTIGFKNKKTIHTFVNKVPGTNKWILVGLYFGQTTFLPRQPTDASITTVDNTSATNPYPGDTCLPVDKSHCGTKTLRKAGLALQGLDASRLKFELVSSDFRNSSTCAMGSVYRFADVYFFGHKTPQLPIDMPSFHSFKRKHSLTVTGTSHDVKTFPDLDGTVTNDVTRTVTVTFTKR